MSSYQYGFVDYIAPDWSGQDQYELSDIEESLENDRTPVQVKDSSIPIISVTSSDKKSKKSRRQEAACQSSEMSSRSTRHHPSTSAGSKKQASSSKPKGKAKSELKDDWTDVTVPEERRRIQNRIAQRKFREKARDNKEQVEREQRNQDLAPNCYTPAQPEQLRVDEELSGLPWGGPSMQFVLARGHENTRQQGSRRASDHVFGDTTYMNAYNNYTYQRWDGQGSSGAEEMGYEEASPYYDYYDTSGASSSR